MWSRELWQAPRLTFPTVCFSLPPMCNLYRMTKARDEVARWFGPIDAATGSNTAEEIYPGYPALVIADGLLQSMSWGFPLAMKGAGGRTRRPKPVNNARTDKLDSLFWRESFEKRRCLIPLTAWAEAGGQRGAMTRSWFSRPDTELFAAAGIWRMSAEWGAVFSMVMTDSYGAVAECHDRMPVLLADHDVDRWTGGSATEAFALCVPFKGDVAVERTSEPWAKRTPEVEAQPGLI